MKLVQRNECTSLTSATPPDESEVVEFGDRVLDVGDRVAEFGAEVLVVPGRDGHLGAVLHLPERDHLEGDGQCLVGAPVRRQNGADEVGRPGADELPRVFAENGAQGALSSQDVRHAVRRVRERRRTVQIWS